MNTNRNWWTTGAAIGIAILSVLANTGVIDAEMANQIQALLVAMGLSKAQDGPFLGRNK